MNPAITHLNPVMGVDIHIIQPPGPVPPVPIPHPYVGMVFDPADYIPIIGSTVSINGLPRAIAGTTGKPIPTHTPIGGTFIKPPGNEDEDFMGSSTVAIDGDAATYMGLPVLSCQDVGMIPPPRLNPKKKTKVKSMVLPLSVVLPIPAGPPVLIGGPPTVSLMAIGMRIGMAGLGRAFRRLARTNLARRAGAAFRRARQRVFRNMRPGFLKCRVLRAEPVDVVTGEVVVDQQDFSIPGRIPIEWNRHYGSQSERVGVCGHGWETPADARLEIEYDGSVLFQDGTGAPFYFEALPAGEPVMEPVDGGVLFKAKDYYAVRLKGNRIYYFHIPEGPADEIPVEFIMDLSRNYLRFIRDENGLKEIEESAGRRIAVTSRNGRIQTMHLIHPEEKRPYPLIRYEYNDQGDLAAVYDALNVPYRFHYKNHCLVRHTDRKHLSFYYAYDACNAGGRCLHAWGDGGLYNYRFEFQDLDGQTHVTDSLGNRSIVQYDNRYQITQEIDASGAATQYLYDEAGRTTVVIDPLGRKTNYQYDAAGNLIELIRPDGSSVRMSYDHQNNPVQITDPRSNVWQQDFNGVGLVKRQISPMGATTEYRYNRQGDLSAVFDPLGAQTRFSRDSFGNLTGITDPLGHQTQLSNDALGNPVSITDPTGARTVYRYDAKSRLIKILRPTHHAVQCTYDTEDNLATYRDEAGNETRFEYTGLNEVARRRNPDGTVVTYRYDTEENLVGVSNERGETFQLIRDHQGRIVEEIDYWGHHRKYAYDPAGTLLESIDPLDRKIRYKFDPLDRLTEKILDDGKSETFAYDEAGNLIRHANDAMVVECEFDADNRLTRETQGDVTVSSLYDLVGNRIKRTTSFGNEVSFAYDQLGNVTGVTINGGHSVNIQRDARGLPVKETLSHSMQRQYHYDSNGLLTQQQILAGANTITRRYEYDPTGNLVARRDSEKGETFFSYDPRGRVVKYVNPEGQIKHLLFDAAGDLLKRRSQEASSYRTMTYEDTEYHFDAAGNLVRRKNSAGETYFNWDADNRLAHAEGTDGTSVKMAYDAVGRRMLKKTLDHDTTFSWDGNRLLSDQIDDRHAREFVYYPDSFKPLAVIDTDKSVLYFHNDHIGVPQEVTTSQGRIVWSAGYDALGGIEKLFVNAFDNPIRMQGQYADDELELYYNRHRYYDACAGVFISRDPLGLVAGNNLYNYAPNVFGWTDPMGLMCRINDAELATEIAEHAGKHNPRIRTDELSELIKETIEEGDMLVLERGRRAYRHKTTGRIVIVDPNSPHRGTSFFPTDPDYFYNLD